MKINTFFTNVLGAQVRNVRWSWGGFDPITNHVFLRVWEDEVVTIDGREFVLLLRRTPRLDSNGFNERSHHLQLMRQGTAGYGVLCTAEDPLTDGPRRIESFDDRALLRLGEVVSLERGVYGEILDRVQVEELSRPPTAASRLSSDLKTILRAAVSNTEREALLHARVGQGAFRAGVLQLWEGRCAVSGARTLEAIRASHIKPWRFATNEERLDPYNGLPLTATLDALFDAGLISFTSTGDLVPSPRLPRSELDLFGLPGGKLSRPPSGRTLEYLAFHRESILRD